jgi:hypothetical protein
MRFLMQTYLFRGFVSPPIRYAHSSRKVRRGLILFLFAEPGKEQRDVNKGEKE